MSWTCCLISQFQVAGIRSKSVASLKRAVLSSTASAELSSLVCRSAVRELNPSSGQIEAVKADCTLTCDTAATDIEVYPNCAQIALEVTWPSHHAARACPSIREYGAGMAVCSSRGTMLNGVCLRGGGEAVPGKGEGTWNYKPQNAEPGVVEPSLSLAWKAVSRA